ncbi:MAG: Hydrogenase/urease accessory protein [Gallionellaceae bacterium]|nr:MAG: Hydrogenase/urease accessory protein [Gallionellaceae bacterium]
MKQSLKRFASLFAACAILFPSLAFAHVGIGEHEGFLLGLGHPFSGFDHLVAMLAIGLWAAQLGGNARWSVPLSFVTVMACSGLLSMYVAPLPFTESGITLSLLILGLLIAATVRLPVMISILIAAAFAIFHGGAHGAELPPNISTLTFASGFVTATALLHLLGIGIASQLHKYERSQWLRVTGVAVILCGLAL